MRLKIFNYYKYIHSFIIVVNLSLTGAFYMTHAFRALQSYDLSGEGINFGSYTYFFDHIRTWRASPDEYQLNAGAISETRTLKTIHTIHSHIHSNKADMIRVIIMAK